MRLPILLHTDWHWVGSVALKFLLPLLASVRRGRDKTRSVGGSMINWYLQPDRSIGGKIQWEKLHYFEIKSR